MDFKTKTIINEIPLSEIPNYSSETDTTYNLASMQNLNLPEISLDEIRSMAENTVAPTGIIDPDPGLLNTFFPHSPLTGVGTPNAPYAGVVALYVEATTTINGVSSSNTSVATGFLVSPTVMVTAAYCIFGNAQTEVENVLVYPFTHQEERPDLTDNDYVTINRVS